MTMPRTLFSPFKLRKLVLANRIVVSPMCQYSAVDGCATTGTLHWGQHDRAASMFPIRGDRGAAIAASLRLPRLYDDACEKLSANAYRSCSRMRRRGRGHSLAHAAARFVEVPWEADH